MPLVPRSQFPERPLRAELRLLVARAGGFFVERGRTSAQPSDSRERFDERRSDRLGMTAIATGLPYRSAKARSRRAGVFPYGIVVAPPELRFPPGIAGPLDSSTKRRPVPSRMQDGSGPVAEGLDDLGAALGPVQGDPSQGRGVRRERSRTASARRAAESCIRQERPPAACFHLRGLGPCSVSLPCPRRAPEPRRDEPGGDRRRCCQPA